MLDIGVDKTLWFNRRHRLNLHVNLAAKTSTIEGIGLSLEDDLFVLRF